MAMTFDIPAEIQAGVADIPGLDHRVAMFLRHEAQLEHPTLDELLAGVTPENLHGSTDWGYRDDSSGGGESNHAAGAPSIAMKGKTTGEIQPLTAVAGTVSGNEFRFSTFARTPESRPSKFHLLPATHGELGNETRVNSSAPPRHGFKVPDVEWDARLRIKSAYC